MNNTLLQLETMKQVEISKEPLSDELLTEILPLAQKCWEESTTIKGESCAYYGKRDFVIEPDTDQYRLLHSVGALTVITLRDAGELVGYVVGILYRALHHRKVLCGLGDSMYLQPTYRFSYATGMAERFEREMTELGAGIIGWPTHMNSPMYDFLKSRGYVGDDIVMEKMLCA